MWWKLQYFKATSHHLETLYLCNYAALEDSPSYFSNSAYWIFRYIETCTFTDHMHGNCQNVYYCLTKIWLTILHACQYYYQRKWYSLWLASLWLTLLLVCTKWGVFIGHNYGLSSSLFTSVPRQNTISTDDKGWPSRGLWLHAVVWQRLSVIQVLLSVAKLCQRKEV